MLARKAKGGRPHMSSPTERYFRRRRWSGDVKKGIESIELSRTLNKINVSSNGNCDNI